MRNQVVEERKMIEDIIKNFNWDKCVRAMESLNWTWALIDRVPEVPDLKNTATQLLESAISGIKVEGVNHNSSYYSSTGGLKAIAWKNRYNQIVGLNLEFILTDWESDGDYFEDDLQNDS